MTTYKGNAGIAKIGSNAIAELTSYTVTETEGTVEDTSLGDAARTYLADGLPTWTAAIAGHYYAGDTTGQALLVMGASLSMEFDPVGITTGLPTLTGTALVTGMTHGEVTNGGVVPFSATLQGTGALVRASHA